jgi:hypothetical protein
MKVAVANLASANEYYHEAITVYDEANHILQKLSTSTYISKLEQLVDIKEDVPRDIKVVFEDEVGNSDKFECIPIQQMQSYNLIRKAFALSYTGETDAGLVLLEKLEEAGIILYNEVELNAAIAELRMSMVRQEISTRPDGNVLLNDSMTLPAMKVQALRGGGIVKKSNLDNELRLIKDNLTNSLERMLEAHRAGCNRERPSIIQALCNGSGFAMFLKNQISNNSRVLMNNNALLSSYYMGKYEYSY